MHPYTEELLQHLDDHRADLRDAVDAVPVELRGQRPAENRWSVDEVLEHLSIVENRIALLLNRQVANAKRNDATPEEGNGSILASIDMERTLDRSRRIVTGESSTPRGELDTEAAWEALENARTLLREVVIAADGLALSDITMPHPALGQLNYYQWIGFVGYHEGRHAEQIREIAGALGDGGAH